MGNQENKSKNFWIWLCTISGIIVAIITPFINVIINEINPSFSDKVPHVEFLFWCLSIILIFAPLMPKLKRVLSVTEGIIDSAESLTQKFNEVAIWRKNEQVEKINITVSDLDNYLILLPLHLSIKPLKGMGVEIHTHRCGSDKGAIEDLLNGNSKFAITDPHYLINHKNPELVLLSPLITKSPMWWLSKKNPTNGSQIYVFSYEDENNDTYVSRLLDKQKKDLKEKKGKNFNIITITIEDVVSSLCKSLKKIKNNDRDYNYINGYISSSGSKGLAGLMSDKNKITAFECLLFSCMDKGDNGKQVKEITTEYFSKIDYFLVTEPDSSIIKKILGYEGEVVSLDPNAIFTGLITKRQYLREYPVECLKMLRGMREGLLKSNVVLMKKDVNTIKKAFQEAIKTLSKEQEESYRTQESHRVQDALSSIDDFLLNESFFPDDLKVFDNSETMYESSGGSYKIDKFTNHLLRKTTSDGEDSDFDNPSIQFIIKGLGYDC